MAYATNASSVQVSQSDTSIRPYDSSQGYIVFKVDGVECARIDNTGALCMGTTGSNVTVGGSQIDASIFILDDGADDLGQLTIQKRWTTVGGIDLGPSIMTARSGLSGSSPVVVVSGDTAMQLLAVAYDGADYERVASIDMQVDGTPGAGDMPGRIVFSTTPDGSATLSERMRIDNAGNVGIGETNPSAPLHVDGLIRSDATFTAVNVSAPMPIEMADTNIYTYAGMGSIDFNGTTYRVPLFT